MLVDVTIACNLVFIYIYIYETGYDIGTFRDKVDIWKTDITSFEKMCA